MPKKEQQPEVRNYPAEIRQIIATAYRNCIPLIQEMQSLDYMPGRHEAVRAFARLAAIARLLKIETPPVIPRVAGLPDKPEYRFPNAGTSPAPEPPAPPRVVIADNREEDPLADVKEYQQKQRNGKV